MKFNKIESNTFKNYTKYATILLAPLFVLNACNHSTHHFEITPIVVDVNNAAKQMNMSDVFSAIEYVPLETSAEHLIGEITQICYYNERFYILDSDITKSVFCFSKNGKFLYKIDRVGSGPGEYIKPVSIGINCDDQSLLLYCSMTHQIISFDLDGNYSHSDKIPFYASYFSYIGNGMYAFAVDYNNSNEKIKKSHTYPNLIVTDSKFKTQYVDIPFSENINFSAIPQLSCCFSNNESYTSMINSCNDTIYHIYKDRVERSYYVDFQKKKKTKAFYKMMNENTTKLGEISKYLYDHDLCNIFHLSESENNLFFIYTHADMVHLAFYNKTQEELIDVSMKPNGGIPKYPVINDMDGGPFCFPYYTDGKDFYSFITPDILLEQEETIVQSKLPQKNNLLSLLENISEDDNPIVVVMTPEK